MRATTRRRVSVPYRDATLLGDGDDGQFTVYICSYLRINIFIVLVQEYMECSKMGLAISIQCSVLLQFPPSTLFNVFHAFGWPSNNRRSGDVTCSW